MEIKDTITPNIPNIEKLIEKKGVQAVQGGLEVFRNAAVDSAPVVTSRLKGSLQVGSNEGIYKVEDQGNVIEGQLGTNVPYARRIEFGFMGEDSLGRRYAQKPNPFFSNALKSNIETIKRVIFNILRL